MHFLIFKNLKEMKKLLKKFISGYHIDHLRKECWSRTQVICYNLAAALNPTASLLICKMR